MSSKIAVSIVIPCYNAEKYILDAINSILNQSFSNLEVIVVDDCSTDNSWSILKSISDTRLRLFQNKSNQGYPCSVNFAINKARGKYIARMDADDVSHKDRLSMQLKFFQKYPQVAIVSCRRGFLSPNGKKFLIRKNIESQELFVIETWIDLFEGNRIFTDPACIFLKKDFDAIGGYNTYQRTGMDVDLWLRLMEYRNSDTLVISEPLYFRRFVSNAITFDSNTSNINVRHHAISRTGYNKDVSKFLKNDSSINSKYNLRISAAAYSFLVGDFKGSREFIKSINIENRVNTYFKFVKKVISFSHNNVVKKL